MKSKYIFTLLALTVISFATVKTLHAEGTVTLTCSEYDVLLDMLNELPDVPCPTCKTDERSHTIEVAAEKGGPSKRGFDCSYQETAGADVWKCTFSVPTDSDIHKCIARYTEQDEGGFGEPVVTGPHSNPGSSHCKNQRPPSGLSPSSISNSAFAKAAKEAALEKAKELCKCKRDCKVKECSTAEGYPKIDTGEGLGGITGMRFEPPGNANTVTKVAVKNKCDGTCHEPKEVSSTPADPGYGCDNQVTE